MSEIYVESVKRRDRLLPMSFYPIPAYKCGKGQGAKQPFKTIAKARKEMRFEQGDAVEGQDDHHPSEREGEFHRYRF